MQPVLLSPGPPRLHPNHKVSLTSPVKLLLLGSSYLHVTKSSAQVQVLPLINLSQASDTVGPSTMVSFLYLVPEVLTSLNSLLPPGLLTPSRRPWSLPSAISWSLDLWSFLFILTPLVISLGLQSNDLNYYLHADDSQMYISGLIFASASSIHLPNKYLTWMSRRHLRLNMSKTELLFCPPKFLLPTILPISIKCEYILPVSWMRNHGIIPDSFLSHCTLNLSEHPLTIFRTDPQSDQFSHLPQTSSKLPSPLTQITAQRLNLPSASPCDHPTGWCPNATFSMKSTPTMLL